MDKVWIQVITYLVILWGLAWKGLALWRSAKNSQRNWFIVLLVVNTVGILEIVYLFRFAKKRLTLAEIRSWSKKLTQKSK